jgi:hypothetical protein
MATCSKARGYDRWLAGNAGSDPAECMDVCCECPCCQVEVCVRLITRPEDAYRLWRAGVCDTATSRMRRHWPALMSPLKLELPSWKSQRRAKQRRTGNFPRELITTRETQNPSACNVLRIVGYWNVWTANRNNVIRNDGKWRLYLVHYLVIWIQVCNRSTLRTVDRPLERLTGPSWTWQHSMNWSWCHCQGFDPNPKSLRLVDLRS